MPKSFIGHYVKIVSVDEGVTSFTPYQFQADIIKSLEDERFVIAKLPRSLKEIEKATKDH